MRDIRASVEVRAFLGDEKLRELHGDAFAYYVCCECGKPGRTTRPTSVVVVGSRIFRVVKLAHAACADSQIIKTDDAGVGVMAGELLRRHASKPQEQAGRLAQTKAAREGVSGMNKLQLARRVGLDHNPLRRRTDKIATCLGALLLAVFLAGAPLLSVAAAGWAGRAAATEQQAAGSWRPSPGVAKAGLAAGHRIPVWVESPGSPADPPLNHRGVLALQVTAAAVVTCALGVVLLYLAWAGRRVLDRRRLAAWEAAWATVGPQWAKRFRSRG